MEHLNELVGWLVCEAVGENEGNSFRKYYCDWKRMCGYSLFCRPVRHPPLNFLDSCHNFSKKISILSVM